MDGKYWFGLSTNDLDKFPSEAQLEILTDRRFRITPMHWFNGNEWRIYCYWIVRTGQLELVNSASLPI